MLIGGAGPASAAIVSHAVTPAVGDNVRYQLVATTVDQGAVRFRCQARPHDGVAMSCYGPDQIRAAYNFQPLLNSGITGAGRTIVIIDAYQSPTIKQDLALFDAVWGYPDPAFEIIAPDGLTPFDITNGAHVTWSSEISLDVEWAHAIAPGAAIKLVLAKSSADADILSVTRYAVEHNLGDVISQSFGEAEMCADPKLVRQEHEVFSRAVDKGITLFASSGDLGAAQPNCAGTALIKAASTPASDPLVTGVGATNLLADAVSGAYQSESVWNDVTCGACNGSSGGGFSTIYHRPGYQAQFQPNNRQRGVPDVAYNGDVRGGVVVAWGVPFGVGAFFVFGGASAGSPQWAGLVALADQKGGRRLGDINRSLYHIGRSDAYGQAFHDITAGNNSFGGVEGFAAGKGWDASTGLGTPDAARLVPLLIAKGEGSGDNQGNGEG
ncbi:MAG TPA: S53 family peptidase [Candidatus Dormibacteraeota bacterium]